MQLTVIHTINQSLRDANLLTPYLPTLKGRGFTECWMTKKLLLLGGGHAHLETLAALTRIQRRGHEVTVVAPAPHHYYSGMGPGMLGGDYTPEEIRFNTQEMVQSRGARFLLGRAVKIDAPKRQVHLENGETLAYDVLSVNVGSVVEGDMTMAQGATLYPVKPIASLVRLKDAIRSRCEGETLRIAIAGGGPSSAEVAGNIRQLVSDHGGLSPLITIYSRGEFFGHFPEKIRAGVMGHLQTRGIQMVENDTVIQVEKESVRLASGRHAPADLVVLATGVHPSPLFADSQLPMGPDGGLSVNRYLQCSNHPEIFGGGDCIHFEEQPLKKVGVYAVRQNKILRDNLLARLEAKPLTPFSPGGSYLLIFNLGGHMGYLHKNGLTLKGRLAFHIKDYIDRHFMRTYQQPG